MSQPERHGRRQSSSDERSPYRNSQSRRSRPADVETSQYTPVDPSAHHDHQDDRRRYDGRHRHQRGESFASARDAYPSAADRRSADQVPLSPSSPNSPEARFLSDGGANMSRKRSLIRPERTRIGRDHPNYHYHQHAANMNTLPSTTGHDPVPDNLAGSSSRPPPHGRYGNNHHNDDSGLDSMPNSPLPRDSDGYIYASRSPEKRHSRRNTMELNDLSEKTTPVVAATPAGGGGGGAGAASRRKNSSRSHKSSKSASRHKRKDSPGEARPPSVWAFYCAVVTFWCPDFVLRRCRGLKHSGPRHAWREKMGLISVILLIMACVGFLTFGFNQAVCGTPPAQFRINEVSEGFMIFHGSAYDLAGSHHPLADGIPLRSDGTGANVLYDLPEKHGGQDGSFLFQNVNGRCKGLITAAADSDVPTNSAGDLSWYFPCSTFNQDGSSTPNRTASSRALGYACHTTSPARESFYKGLERSADVYFDWSDLRNQTRNLVVYSGQVLDLDLLNWFNDSQVVVPDRFKELRDRDSAINKAIRGRDVTRAFQTSADRKIAGCLEEIIKVGRIDSISIGCIAAKVVLYSMLILILSVVAARYALALFFSWFVSRGYAAKRTSQPKDAKKRNQQIEDWSNDIFLPPARMLPGSEYANGSTVNGSDRTSRRGSSFLPTTSRFSTTNGLSSAMAGGQKRGPTTMASQGQQALLQAQNAAGQQSGGGSRALSMYGSPQHQSATGNSTNRHSLLRPELFSSGDTNDGMTLSSSALAPPHTTTNTASSGDTYGPMGFIHEAVVPQPPADWMPWGFPLAHTMCLVTAYSEGELGLRTTLDSIAVTDYPNSHKVILVICDGIIKGHGETESTPEIVLGMLKDHSVPPGDVQAFSYVAVESGSKRHNMAQVYSGFYDYGHNSSVPANKQQPVPMMVVVKCGTPDEARNSKPGNRGKRDSQIILMSFLQKVMFDERMTELEFEMFNGLWNVTGISPDYYEMVLMVDADTKVFPDSLTHMVSAMVKDPDIMGLCGETKIANKRDSWVTAIQVFEYFISHHMAKSFESVFGGVTCLPGCFCMYRIKAPKGPTNYWVPILANPDVVEHYSENVVDTLHKKNLLLLGEDRYLTTLMLRTFPKRKQVFVPQAVCKTTVPDKFSVLLSQRRRWINSTIHNLMELVLVKDLCGTFCFSMQFMVFVELMGTLVLPAAITFTFYVVIISIVQQPVQIIPLVLLALILGLPAVLIVVTAHSWTYVVWMIIYLFSLPVWNFILPVYAFWKFDDFSWGDTRKTAGETTKKAGIEYEGEFDSSKITMKRWAAFERERRLRIAAAGTAPGAGVRPANDAPGTLRAGDGADLYDHDG